MTSLVAPLDHATLPPDASRQPLRRLLRVALQALDRAVAQSRRPDELPPEWFRYPPI